MKITRTPFKSFVISSFAGVVISQAAFADDIETLTGQLQDFAGPNVTLVIDTSGSMNSQVFIDSDTAPYDSAVNYTGPFDIFEGAAGASQRLFYTLTPAGSIEFPDENDLDSIQWVELSAFQCAAGKSVLDSDGIYTDRIGQLSFFVEGAGTWSFMVPAFEELDGQNLITECRADFGVHGNGNGLGNFPINLAGLTGGTDDLFPWTLDENDPRVIDWNEISADYTFFTTNYLNWIYERKQDEDPVVQTRLEIVQSVAKDLIKTLKVRSIANNDGLRLGLMRFSSNGSGGMVIAPTVDLATSEDTLIDEVNALTASGSTPLAETMYETYLYHTGGQVEFGNISSPVLSVNDARDGPNYKSPIEASCQKNYAVLLTDGQPNGDFEADSQISALAGGCTDSCLDEMTGYLSSTDLAGGTGFTGEQTLDTFIIGFFTDSPLLESATTGMYDSTPDNNDDTPDAPGYFLANDPDELSDAFDVIFSSQGINSTVSSFTAPSVSVNSLNRLTNRDTLYFTLYAPSTLGQPHWDGNLKAYKIGRVDGSNDIRILDANSNPAVDDATGLFADDAVSLWGTEQDGPNVELGGVAGRLSAQRNIFSDLSSNENLNNDANRVTRANSDTIGAIPGMPAGDELLNLIDFAAGLDSEGGARQVLGDPLHSQPLVINFDSGSSTDEDLLLLFGTNDGYLHAIDPIQANDTSNDLELFAFIPKELMPQLARIKADNPSPFPVVNKVYGMDGPISAWIENDDEDLIVESGEKLWVYAGMRRGGRSYYAFDFTSRTNPKLKFKIDNTRAGYSDLGQTWSEATQATIKLGNDEKEVLIFGGGYDTNQDTGNSADSVGNAVYIADAKTGQLIWSAGDADSDATLKLDAMTHSIPSDVRIIDINQDGFIDRMYVGDMGAQVWRFDITSNPTGSNPPITGGRIADLSGEGSANERRFYSAPSVSRYVEDGRGFLAIGIGSGYRSHPLETQIDDRFYVLRDDNVFAPALSPSGEPEYGDTNMALLTQEPELIPLTLDGIQDGSLAIDTGDFGRGWFLDLNADSGEKSLSSAVTAEGRIFFTTYSPRNPSLSCVPTAAAGLGRFYGIDVLTGLPALYDDVDFAPPIASVELGPTGIPPQPRLVFVAPDCDNCSIDPGDVSDDGLLVLPSTADIVAQIGTQAFNIGLSSRPTRTYWVEF